MLVKDLTYGFKDIDTKQGIVTGYFAHFGSKDSDGDVILHGAFTKSIKENFNRIRHLLDHDKTKAVGVLQKLEQDSIGLYYESKAGRHTLGQDFLLMAEDGIIKEHSIGYSVVKEERRADANYLLEIHLKEGSSLQAWGANANTPIVGIKDESDICDMLDLLGKALRKGKYSDETFEKVIIPKYNELTELIKTTKPNLEIKEITLPSNQVSLHEFVFGKKK